MRKTIVLLVIVLLVTVPAIVAAETSTTLTVEEATGSDSDSETLSYTFQVTTSGNTAVSIPGYQTGQSASGGDIQFDFVRWEQIGSGRSGSGTSWRASDGEQYRIVYEASTSTGVDEFDEGTYRFDVDPQDSDGTVYSETFSVSFDLLSPEFGSTNSPSDEIEFEGESSKGTEVTATFDNVGDGVLVPESVTYSGLPSEMSASTEGLDNDVSAGDQGTFDIDVDARESISEGTYRFTATVRDNLGNTVQIPIEVEVFKPPGISVNNGNNLDLGDVLLRETESTDVSVSEITGYGPVNDLSVSVSGEESNAAVRFSSFEGRSIRSSGSIVGAVGVEVGPRAEQYEKLSWDLEFAPSNSRSNSKTLDVNARVIYRPYFDGASTEDARLVYDEPRSETEEFRQTRTVTVRNGGDLRMDVTDIDTRADTGVSVEVIEDVSSIAPRSERTLDIAVVGDSNTAEGTYTYEVDIRGADAELRGSGSATKTVRGEATIVHTTDISTETDAVTFGEIPVAKERTRSVDVRERLGYQAVKNLSIRKTAGPDTWLRVVEKPETLSAGERKPMIVSTEFDAGATLYQNYTWRFQISGENISPETVTVTATPRPVQCTEVVKSLEGWSSGSKREQMASAMAEGVRKLEERLRRNPKTGPIRDLARACTASRSALLFLNADRTAESLIGQDNHTGAQPYVGRMAAGFNTTSEYVDRIETNEVRTTMSDGISTGETILDDGLQSQIAHYNQTLSGDDSALKKAGSFRELSRLAALEGDDTRAKRLAERTERLFERYTSLVSEGTADLQRARQIRDRLDKSLFVSVFGVRVFWIGELDRFNSQTDAVLSNYRSAENKLEQAGATSRADTAANERAEMASAYDIAFLASAGVGGGVGFLFLVSVMYEVRSLYRYIQDSEAAVSGDFLL